MSNLSIAEAEPSIDSVKKVFTTDPKEVDKTDECTVCEAFAAVFGDRLSSNKPFKIEDMDLVAICYEVETMYKEQVNTTN